MKSEGSQHIYNSLKNAVKTKFGNRIMVELGVIKGLEKDKVKNYILIPMRAKDKDGKEHTSSWSVHEIHKDEDVKYKFDEDDDRWSKEERCSEKIMVKE